MIVAGLAEPGRLNVAEEHDDQNWHACKQQDTQYVAPARNGKMVDKPATYAARTVRGDSPLTELPNHHSKSKEAEHGRHEHHHEDQ